MGWGHLLDSDSKHVQEQRVQWCLALVSEATHLTPKVGAFLKSMKLEIWRKGMGWRGCSPRNWKFCEFHSKMVGELIGKMWTGFHQKWLLWLRNLQDWVWLSLESYGESFGCGSWKLIRRNIIYSHHSTCSLKGSSKYHMLMELGDQTLQMDAGFDLFWMICPQYP